MNSYLEKIFETGKTPAGSEIGDSATSRDQCLFLQSLIREAGSVKSIEIGLAFGMSTLAITEEVVKNGGTHTVIDKFQHSYWKGEGLSLVNAAGYSGKIRFYEEYCYQVLSELLYKKERFDFAYIDSTKQFDWLLTDFFLLDKMLDINGMIVFDDVGYFSVRKLIRFITQFPSYKIKAVFPANFKPGPGPAVLHAISSLPGFRTVFKPSYTFDDYKKGINTHCMALQKIAEDERSWNWHKPF